MTTKKTDLSTLSDFELQAELTKRNHEMAAKKAAEKAEADAAAKIKYEKEEQLRREALKLIAAHVEKAMGSINSAIDIARDANVDFDIDLDGGTVTYNHYYNEFTSNSWQGSNC